MIRSSVLLIMCLAFLASYAPSAQAHSGGGGGGGGSDGGGSGNAALGSTPGSGATVDNTLHSFYAPFSAGVTNMESLQQSADRYNEMIGDANEHPLWYSRHEIDSGWYQLAVSAVAWNGKTEDVRVVRLAYVLESMMIEGAIPAHRAWELLTIYAAALERKKARQGR